MTHTPTQDPIARRVMRARTRLVLDRPMLGSIALRLQLTADASIPTMATDGRSLMYSPEYVAEITDAELQGVIAHEVLHVALEHPWRRDDREPRRWNQACDHAINPIVVADGLTLPADGLSVAVAEYPGKSAEAIYRLLPTEEDGDQGDDGDDGGDGDQTGAGAAGGNADMGPGEVRDFPGTAEEAATARAEMRAAVQQAAQQAQQAGKLSGDLADLIGEAQRPRVNWRAVLRRFVQQCADRSDYRWSMPNSRYTHLGVYLPHLHGERTPPLAVAIDTSGSVEDSQLEQFASEVRAIHQDTRPEQLHLIWADAAVKLIDSYGADDWPDLTRAPGRGGTDFRPAIEAALSLDPAPAALVYLTDGYGPAPEAAPVDLPILWVLIPGGTSPAPWAKCITMEADQ